MKRIMLVLLSVIILALAVGFDTGRANAASLITYVDGRYVWGKGIIFVFEATGYKNRDVRGATIFAGSNFHDLGCTVNGEEDRIVCVLRGGLTEFAGEQGVIYLAGQIFYVTIPDWVLPQVEPLVCGEFETTGAYVTFSYAEGQPDTFFLSGSSLQDVQQSAQEWMDWSEGFITGFEVVSELTCGEIPS